MKLWTRLVITAPTLRSHTTDQWLAEKDASINVKPPPPPANRPNGIPATACPATASTSASCSFNPPAHCSSSGPKSKPRQRPRNKKAASRLRPVHIQLAEDDAPTSQSESDCSAYDSFNEEETGLCTIRRDDAHLYPEFASVFGNLAALFCMDCFAHSQWLSFDWHEQHAHVGCCTSRVLIQLPSVRGMFVPAFPLLIGLIKIKPPSWSTQSTCNTNKALHTGTQAAFIIVFCFCFFFSNYRFLPRRK